MRRLERVGLAAILAIAACARGIETDYSPSVRFSPYRTFAMVPPPERAPHQPLDERLREDVAVRLTHQGLTETARDAADLFVGYGVVDHTNSRFSDGTVVVSLVDAKTRKVVWEARADHVLRLPARNSDRTTAQISQAVAGIFARFPPALRDEECRGVDPCL